MPSVKETAKFLDFRGLIITSIITALTFVIGLFWRDAIMDTINQFIPLGQGLIYKYIAAIAVTAIVVVVAYTLMKMQNLKINKLLEKAEEAGRRTRRVIKKRR